MNNKEYLFYKNMGWSFRNWVTKELTNSRQVFDRTAFETHPFFSERWPISGKPQDATVATYEVCFADDVPYRDFLISIIKPPGYDCLENGLVRQALLPEHFVKQLDNGKTEMQPVDTSVLPDSVTLLCILTNGPHAFYTFLTEQEKTEWGDMQPDLLNGPVKDPKNLPPHLMGRLDAIIDRVLSI